MAVVAMLCASGKADSLRKGMEEAAAALMHIKRFKGEGIAQLWDIGFEQPADSPNENGMF